jgi:hypothetical protein
VRYSRRDFITAAGATALGAATDKAEAGEPGTNQAPPASGPQSEAIPAYITWNRRVPVRYETDVAVIGGGIAGVSAACAAARSGARVILVERFAVTGGNCTVGGVASFCGETRGQGEVFDAIVADLEAWKAIEPYRPYPEADHRVFDHEILAVVLQELLLRRSVMPLLHTRFVDVCVEGGRISECIVCGKSGPEALRARQFIDCTGEADLVAAAGFETVKGRPDDHVQLPMSLMFFVRHVPEQEASPQVPEGWFKAIRDKGDLPMTSVWPNGPGGNALKIKIPGFDATSTVGLTKGEIQARRRMMEVLDYYQRVEKKPWRFDHCSPQIGIREGRRVVGDYILTVDDLRAGRRFDDAIARGVYPLDAHSPTDDKRTYVLPPDQRNVPPYQVPLRCLFVKGAENLMVAGRCFSADQLALSSARVTTTCSMMGQAAGIVAALAVRDRRAPRQIDPRAVRRLVEQRGASLGT